MAMKIGKNTYQVLSVCVVIETAAKLWRLSRTQLATCENQVIDLRLAFEQKTIADTEKSGGVMR